MDQTNYIDVDHGFVNERALKVADTIHKWNKSGKKPIYYCSAIGAIQWEPVGNIVEEEAQKLWERYCMEERGEDYYTVDGKPLLILFGRNGQKIWEEYVAKGGNTEYADKFTLKYADCNNTPGYYGWTYPKGTVITEEVSVVMPGWDNKKSVTPVPRNHGEWYRNAWENIFESDVKPKTVIITSFNAYEENTGVFTAKTSIFGDDAPDMYWNMTKEYIKLYTQGGVYELGSGGK